MKNKVVVAVVTLFLVTVLASSINVVPILAPASATVFVDPPTIRDMVIGENVTVNINVSNVNDLYGWQAGLTFNPDVLNCTGYYEGEFLKRKGVKTLWLDRTPPWDNTKGLVYCHGCCLIGPMLGVNGSGQLGYLTFEVIGTGVSDLHLTDVVLVDHYAKRIQHEVVDILTVSWGRGYYSVEIISNLTGIDNPPDPPASGLFNHNFSAEEKTVTFNVITHHDGFYDVTIPKAILSCDNLSDWTVEVDGSNVTFVLTESPTETSLYFTYHNGTHKVEITGTVLVTGDLNDDGIVDTVDLTIVSTILWSTPIAPKWNPHADLNGDDLIDIVDLTIVAIHLWETW